MITFENKRDHIVQIIQSAWMDKKLWEEATQLTKSQAHPKQRSSESTSQILPPEIEMYCIADASWKSPTDKVGIGQFLISKEGIPKLQRIAAINPTNTPLVAEAMVMLLAVQQMHRLRFKKVVFLRNTFSLIKKLQDKAEDVLNEATPIVSDIKAMTNLTEFSFHYAPRNLLCLADQLAKNARVNNKHYVITLH